MGFGSGWRCMRVSAALALALALELALAVAPIPAAAQVLAPNDRPGPMDDAENGLSSPQPTPRPPITGAITYFSDLNTSVSGGERRGSAYLQRIGLIGDADLDRLIGWRGAALHVSGQSIVGTGLSDRVGTLLQPSWLEAEPALRLYNLWVQQAIGARATLRAGQFNAGQEFGLSTTAGLFINSTFGWPASFASDLPSGGSTYPLAGPGARLELRPDRQTTARVAVFSGDPAGRGGGDPQRRDLHGLNGIRLKGAPFVIAEIVRTAGGGDPAWTVVLGGWAHLDSFPDLRIDNAGHSLVSPQSDGQPLQHGGNYAGYAIADARLWQSGKRALHGFVRMTAGPSNRNPIDLYLDTGLSLSGLLPGRPNDTLGIGFGIARMSPDLRALVRERAALAGLATPVPDFESVVEVTYQLKLKNGLSFQPNLQWIAHPAAMLLDDDAGLAPPPKGAIVLGLRTSFRL